MTIVVLIVMLLPAISASQTADETVSVAKFQAGTKADQDRWMRGLFNASVQPETPADLAAVIALRLSDESPSIRAQALALYAARAGARRFSNDFSVLARAKNEVGALTRIRPSIIAALKDPAADVRDAAVMALGNLDSANGEGVHVLLQPQTIQLLSSVLEQESDPAVRATIVQALSLSRNHSPQIAAVLAERINDPSAEVRIFAVRGVQKVPPAAALTMLRQGLRDRDPKVRAIAAQMAPKLGQAAVELIEDIDRAAQGERDPAAAEEMRRAGTALRSVKPQKQDRQ